MSERFRADPVLAGLTSFQRNSVEHIINRFYGPANANRFLVADETGLGKTIVARGVIARAIEELEDHADVERIDIVYVCSNQDLAHQNLRKLNVTDDEHHSFVSRLTLLAKHTRHLRPEGGTRFTKPVNLVSFTPGTSFEKGWRSGKAEERAMLYLLLEREGRLHLEERRRSNAALRLLQGGVSSWQRFEAYVENLRKELKGDLDETVAKAFSRAIRAKPANGNGRGRVSLLTRVDRLLDQAVERRRIPWDDVWALVGDLRSTLAQAGVQVLEPDLVILDEFQRFRHLLDETTEAGELAHQLYDYGADLDATGRPTAKTLLLSATPYKPFTYAEESEHHHEDFMRVVAWLSKWSDHNPTVELTDALAAYRDAVIAGRPVDGLTDSLRDQLLQVMTRTERPKLLTERMTRENIQRVERVAPESMLGFVALKELAALVDAPMSIEYWKSAAYFANFMDGYKIADKIKQALHERALSARVREQLKKLRRIDFRRVREVEPLDPDMGNARLRTLNAETIGEGWWKLLWIPPTLPYLNPGGPYAAPTPGGHVTKRLVFSSWTATPTAIAALLSYEAERLAVGDAWRGKTAEERETDRRSRRSRLAYRIDSRDRGRPATMAHLALFWPMPGLAALADPRRWRRTAGRLIDSDELINSVVPLTVQDGGETTGAQDTPHWWECFARQDSLPPDFGEEDAPDITTALAGQQASGESDDDGESTASAEALARHVAEAMRVHVARQDRSVTAEARRDIAQVAAHSPANIAYRALQRISHHQPAVTPRGLWFAAAHLTSALRTTFSRPETTMLLDQLMPGEVYWRAVLQYCAWGNLQAVMDEYLHHLAASQGASALDDASLLDLAQMAAGAIALRPVNYEVFDPDDPDPATRQRMSARFALRYGGRREAQESIRQPQVRQAFNSPFWPFVLASTSVGQEGIDFHWWCHSILHWNTPANPIDFEQREGRIDRYDGHAVRRNIAQHHADEILSADDLDPWVAAYRIAADRADQRLGAFAPHWVYNGNAKIERHVAPYALSTDEAKLARVKKDAALYRLTFGQPRQEDMLELLKQKYADSTPEDLARMRLDLSAPARSQGYVSE